MSAADIKAAAHQTKKGPSNDGPFFVWWPGATSQNPREAAPVLGFNFFVKVRVQAGVQQ